MGFDDRDYAQQDQPGVHLNAPQTLTTKLVIITGMFYVLQLFVEQSTQWFALPAAWFVTPWDAYRLLSYGFMHDTQGIMHIFFNMLMLWMFGREIEMRYGQLNFLVFYLTAIVFAGLVWSAIEFALGNQMSYLVGASGGISGIFVLFALNFPRRQVLFMFVVPMPMWVAALIVVGIDAFGAMERTSPIAFTAHLAGASYGLLYYMTGWAPGLILARLFDQGPKRRKPDLRVHAPSDEDSTDDELDAILKKIQEQGRDSLTWRERRQLEKASREYQQRRK